MKKKHNCGDSVTVSGITFTIESNIFTVGIVRKCDIYALYSAFRNSQKNNRNKKVVPITCILPLTIPECSALYFSDAEITVV